LACDLNFENRKILEIPSIQNIENPNKRINNNTKFLQNDEKINLKSKTSDSIVKKALNDYRKQINLINNEEPNL
jgi:hypothetical protein